MKRLTEGSSGSEGHGLRTPAWVPCLTLALCFAAIVAALAGGSLYPATTDPTRPRRPAYVPRDWPLPGLYAAESGSPGGSDLRRGRRSVPGAVDRPADPTLSSTAPGAAPGAAPLPPGDLQAESVSLPAVAGQLVPGAQVHLSWRDPNPADAVSAFRIYRLVQDGYFDFYDQSPAGADFLDVAPFGNVYDPGPTPPGTDLRYRVSAVSGDLESALSVEASPPGPDLADARDEPNNLLSTATPIRLQTIRTRRLEADDVDYYRLQYAPLSILRASLPAGPDLASARLGLFFAPEVYAGPDLDIWSDPQSSLWFVRLGRASTLQVASASPSDIDFDGIGDFPIDPEQPGLYTILVDLDREIFPREHAVSDPIKDTFGADRFSSVGAPDLESMRAVTEFEHLRVTLRFTSSVSPTAEGRPDSVSGFLEIHTDTDLVTGYGSIAAQLCPGPVYPGAEYGVSLETGAIFVGAPEFPTAGLARIDFTGEAREIVEVTISLADIGIDPFASPFVGVAAVVGNALTPTDCAPDGGLVYDSPGTDTDADGLADSSESDTHFTNPLNDDTDSGGEPDGAEVSLGRDPLDPLDDLIPDGDGDGLSDLQEMRSGSDLSDPDSDDDGVLDGTDCLPLDTAVGEPPAEVGPTLQLDPSGFVLSWDPAAGAFVHNVYRGRIERGQPFRYNHVCFDRDRFQTFSNESSSPGRGEVFYYLANGSNICGEGTLGSGASGPRPNENACADAAVRPPFGVAPREFLLPPLPEQIYSPGSQVLVSWKDPNAPGSAGFYQLFKSLRQLGPVFVADVYDVTRLVDPAPFERFSDDLFRDLSGTGLTFPPETYEIRYQVEARTAHLGGSPLSAEAHVEPVFSRPDPGGSLSTARLAGCFDRITEFSSPDVDFFRIEAPEGAALRVEVFAQRLGSTLDPVLGLFRSDGSLIRLNDDTFGLDPLLEVPLAGAPGEPIFVGVTSYQDFDFDGTDALTSGLYTLVVDCLAAL